MARQLVVEIVGDASHLNRATSEAVGHAETLTGKLQGIGKGMVIGAGIGTFNLLKDAIRMGVDQLDEMHRAFKEDEASQALLAQALQNNIPAWDGNTAALEAYAAAQQRLGFSDDEVRASISQLVGVTHDLTEAQELNSLAQDLARAKGIDLATATDIVTKAHEGNGRALKALGIDVGDATTAAELLDAIQQNVTGSAETWAQTSEGRTVVAQAKVQEAMEKVGRVIDDVASVLIPILADAFVGIATTIGDFWDATEPIRTQLEPIFRAVFGAIGGIIGGAMSAIGAIVGAIGTAIQKAKELADWVTGNNKPTTTRTGPVATSGAPAGVQGRATGGPVTAGRAYLVGEGGPELFIPGASGQIVPNGGGMAPVVIQLTLDGRTVAQVVDERLGYKYATAARTAGAV